MDRSLLTVKETAELLNVSICTIYRQCSHGILPHVRKHFGIRINRDNLQQWLEKDSCIPRRVNSFYVNSLTCLPPHDIYKAKGGISMAKVRSLTFAQNGEFLCGTVYQRKTKKGPRWCINFAGPGGKRVRKIARLARTQEEALIVLQDEIQKAFDHEYSIKREKEKVTFRDFAAIYLENYAKVKKKSWGTDLKYLNAQLIPFFGEMELSVISPLHVNKFMVKRQKDGVKNSTINRELTVLKKMLNLAIEWQFDIQKNPVKKGNFFSEDEYKRNRILSFEEEQKLFKTAARHLKPILICALSTGMRYSEILGLKWENCDLKNQQIVVQASDSKSGKSRVVPINDTLLVELKKLKQLNKGGSDFVFLYLDPCTGKLRPVKTVRRAFVMACERAKIKDITFHDLRHTFGSRLISRGADPVSVKDLLGHANLKTTEIYLHSSMKRMQEAVNLLDVKEDVKPNMLSPFCHRFQSKEDKSVLNAYFSVN